MVEFKVGDRVVHDEDDTGVITHFDGHRIWVHWDKTDDDAWVTDGMITHSEDPSNSSFEQSVRYHTNKIADLLISKNKQYANSALDPIRVFSKADRMEQLRVRADDKLSRIRNGDTSEDALTDLAGYIILMKIAEESA